MNVPVSSQVFKRCKICGLGKLGNLKKTPEMLGFDDKYPADHPKFKF